MADWVIPFADWGIGQRGLAGQAPSAAIPSRQTVAKRPLGVSPQPMPQAPRLLGVTKWGLKPRAEENRPRPEAADAGL